MTAAVAWLERTAGRLQEWDDGETTIVVASSAPDAEVPDDAFPIRGRLGWPESISNEERLALVSRSLATTAMRLSIPPLPRPTDGQLESLALACNLQPALARRQLVSITEDAYDSRGETLNGAWS